METKIPKFYHWQEIMILLVYSLNLLWRNIFFTLILLLFIGYSLSNFVFIYTLVVGYNLLAWIGEEVHFRFTKRKLIEIMVLNYKKFDYPCASPFWTDNGLQVLNALDESIYDPSFPEDTRLTVAKDIGGIKMLETQKLTAYLRALRVLHEAQVKYRAEIDENEK